MATGTAANMFVRVSAGRARGDARFPKMPGFPKQHAYRLFSHCHPATRLSSVPRVSVNGLFSCIYPLLVVRWLKMRGPSRFTLPAILRVIVTVEALYVTTEGIAERDLP